MTANGIPNKIPYVGVGVYRRSRWQPTPNIEFVGITNDVLTDVAKHYLTVWMRGDAGGGLSQIRNTAEINELGWFSPDQLPTPLHLYFQNLLDGHCWPHFTCEPPL